MMRCVRYCLLLQLMILALAVQAQPRVEVFELENRQAVELVRQLQALYPEQSAVFSPDGQRLMVKAEERVIREIGELVTRLDVAPAQMRITVRRQEGHRENSSGGSRTYSTRNSQSEQSIVVQDGETARIEAGSIRRVTRAIHGGDHVALIAEDTPMTEGFLVQPHALGSSQVELRIASFNNQPPHHRAQGSDRETAAVVTMRRAMPGEWVALGSSTEESASTRDGQTWSTSTGGANNQHWSVKVDVLP